MIPSNYFWSLDGETPIVGPDIHTIEPVYGDTQWANRDSQPSFILPGIVVAYEGVVTEWDIYLVNRSQAAVPVVTRTLNVRCPDGTNVGTFETVGPSSVAAGVTQKYTLRMTIENEPVFPSVGNLEGAATSESIPETFLKVSGRLLYTDTYPTRRYYEDWQFAFPEDWPNSFYGYSGGGIKLRIRVWDASHVYVDGRSSIENGRIEIPDQTATISRVDGGKQNVSLSNVYQNGVVPKVNLSPGDEFTFKIRIYSDVEDLLTPNNYLIDRAITDYSMPLVNPNDSDSLVVQSGKQLFSPYFVYTYSSSSQDPFTDEYVTILPGTYLELIQTIKLRKAVPLGLSAPVGVGYKQNYFAANTVAPIFVYTENAYTHTALGWYKNGNKLNDVAPLMQKGNLSCKWAGKIEIHKDFHHIYDKIHIDLSTCFQYLDRSFRETVKTTSSFDMDKLFVGDEGTEVDGYGNAAAATSFARVWNNSGPLITGVGTVKLRSGSISGPVLATKTVGYNDIVTFARHEWSPDGPHGSNYDEYTSSTGFKAGETYYYTAETPVIERYISPEYGHPGTGVGCIIPEGKDASFNTVASVWVSPDDDYSYSVGGWSGSPVVYKPTNKALLIHHINNPNEGTLSNNITYSKSTALLSVPWFTFQNTKPTGEVTWDGSSWDASDQLIVGKWQEPDEYGRPKTIKYENGVLKSLLNSAKMNVVNSGSIGMGSLFPYDYDVMFNAYAGTPAEFEVPTHETSAFVYHGPYYRNGQANYIVCSTYVYENPDTYYQGRLPSPGYDMNGYIFGDPQIELANSQGGQLEFLWSGGVENPSGYYTYGYYWVVQDGFGYYEYGYHRRRQDPWGVQVYGKYFDATKQLGSISLRSTWINGIRKYNTDTINLVFTHNEGSANAWVVGSVVSGNSNASGGSDKPAVTSVPPTPATSAPVYEKLVVVGDSLSAWGSYTGAHPSFPAPGGVYPPSDRWHDLLVQRGLVKNRVDSSFPGYTTRTAIERPIAPPQSADLTIIYLGANDQNDNYPGGENVNPFEYGNNLRILLDRYPAPRQILMFPWRWNASLLNPEMSTDEGNFAVRQQYLQVAQAIANERGIILIDLGLTFNSPTVRHPEPLPPYLVDYLIHASAYGHKGIADIVQSVISSPAVTGLPT